MMSRGDIWCYRGCVSCDRGHMNLQYVGLIWCSRAMYDAIEVKGTMLKGHIWWYWGQKIMLRGHIWCNWGQESLYRGHIWFYICNYDALGSCMTL
jgi:hypothetical protein